jgi:hypothetical protein
MDESSEPGNFSDSNHEMDNTSSVEDQKATAVVAVIDTSTEDPASGIEHSKRCRRTNKLLFTKKVRELLDTGSDGDIFGSIKKELPNASPTLKGRWQSLTILQLGFSIQMGRPSLK